MGLAHTGQCRTIKMKSLMKSCLLVILLLDVISSASIDHAKGDHSDHKIEELADFKDTPRDHIRQQHDTKPAKTRSGNYRVLRKKKRTKFEAMNKDWEGFYDSESDFNTINIDNIETEYRGYSDEEDEGIEYYDHAHPHEHLMLHDATSVYSKYEDLRPLDLAKLVPMLSLVGLYMLTPTYLNARRKRSSFRISADGDVLNESDERYECFLRLACRVGELSTEVGVQKNPLVEELMTSRKFIEKVKVFKEENMCNTSGCEVILNETKE